MAKQRVGVVDYGAGNLRSVETALTHVGVEFFISSDPERIHTADRLIFPGVGEAKAAMTVLRKTGLDEAIVEFYRTGKPFLGICIGCQVVFQASEERNTCCLGIVSGIVERFPNSGELKVPHMGWNQVHQLARGRNHPVLRGIPGDSSFYFVHSYYPKPHDSRVTFCETDYGILFSSGIVQDNLIAFQFHPEKSGEKGLKLLSNFLQWDI